MGQVMPSGKVRLMATCEADVAAHIEQLAEQLDMSVSKLLGMLLGIAVHTGSGTIEAFADELARLQGRRERDWE